MAASRSQRRRARAPRRRPGRVGAGRLRPPAPTEPRRGCRRGHARWSWIDEVADGVTLLCEQSSLVLARPRRHLDRPRRGPRDRHRPLPRPRRGRGRRPARLDRPPAGRAARRALLPASAGGSATRSTAGVRPVRHAGATGIGSDSTVTCTTGTRGSTATCSSPRCGCSTARTTRPRRTSRRAGRRGPRPLRRRAARRRRDRRGLLVLVERRLPRAGGARHPGHATRGALDATSRGRSALRETVAFPHRMHLGATGTSTSPTVRPARRPISRGTPCTAPREHVGDQDAAAHAAAHRHAGDAAATETRQASADSCARSPIPRGSTQPALSPLPREVWLPSTQVLRRARARRGSADGLTLAVKGGHNGEHHNHNDVGSFVVASDGVPVIVDAGRPTYTAQTFGPDRYDIWTMQSSWHNVPEIDGVAQDAGAVHAASDVVVELQEDARRSRSISRAPTRWPSCARGAAARRSIDGVRRVDDRGRVGARCRSSCSGATTPGGVGRSGGELRIASRRSRRATPVRIALADRGHGPHRGREISTIRCSRTSGERD